MCCLKGKVFLAPFTDPPEMLKALFDDPAFLMDVHSYYSVFAFTSHGASVDQSQADARDVVYTFHTHGTISHRLGSLLPAPGDNPEFAQTYVFDGDMENQVAARCSIFDGLNRDVVSVVQQELSAHNPFVQQFISTGKRVREEGREEVRVVIHNARGTDVQRYTGRQQVRSPRSSWTGAKLRSSKSPCINPMVGFDLSPT